MKSLTVSSTAVAAALFIVGIAFAQRPGNDDDRSRERGARSGERKDSPNNRGGRPADAEGRRGRGGERGFRPPVFPLLAALDADKDGEISAKEIENAVAALKTLDKNKDGKLTRDEMRPKGGPSGRRGFGPPPEGGQPGRNAAGRRDFLKRIFERDANKDGKISKDELPDFLKGIFERADTNKDGVLDRKELENRNRGGRRTGGRRPEGSRSGGEGRRPQRPDNN